MKEILHIINSLLCVSSFCTLFIRSSCNININISCINIDLPTFKQVLVKQHNDGINTKNNKAAINLLIRLPCIYPDQVALLCFHVNSDFTPFILREAKLPL
jgi:hypothetical protein